MDEKLAAAQEASSSAGQRRRPRLRATQAEAAVVVEISEGRARRVVAAAPKPGLQAEVAAALVFEMGIDSFFGASHAMRPNGPRHTHSFRVQASFITDQLDSHGMTVGFREVSNLLDAEARRFASQYLNEVEPFTEIEPTGENLAAVIHRNLLTSLAEMLPDGPQLVAVTLWENPTSFVRVGRRRAA